MNKDLYKKELAHLKKYARDYRNGNFTHQYIGFSLAAIAKEHGVKWANKMIDDGKFNHRKGSEDEKS